jgi:xanthine dehydrogenase accessory factor
METIPMIERLVLFESVPVCIRGGGDLASGVAYRLVRAGFPVAILELSAPLVIRRTVAFAEAVYAGEVQIEGLVGRHIDDPAEALAEARAGRVPVLVDPTGVFINQLDPAVVVDARLLKANPGDVSQEMAPLVVALGPGYTAGVHCHAVVETMRGHRLGRVVWEGTAEPNTGVPGAIGGRTADRVLRAPASGLLESRARIGDCVEAGDVVATIDGIPVESPFGGVLRGLLHDGVKVPAGFKIGDVDPRGVRAHCFTISDKSLAVGGAVLEAILTAPQIRQRILAALR